MMVEGAAAATLLQKRLSLTSVLVDGVEGFEALTATKYQLLTSCLSRRPAADVIEYPDTRSLSRNSSVRVRTPVLYARR